MPILGIILALLPFLKSLILDAEEAHKDVEKSGAIKKQSVQDGAMQVLNGFAAVSKGGQANTVAQVASVLPDLIDLGVAMANAAGELSGHGVVVSDPPNTMSHDSGSGA